MTPIPEPIASRWRPMWGTAAHPERPWWRVAQTSGTVLTSFPPVIHWGWRRCDGVVGPEFAARDVEVGDPATLCRDSLARIDAEHPLPAPPPMEGQVWVFSRTEEDAGLGGWHGYTLTECDVKEGFDYAVLWSDGERVKLRSTDWSEDGMRVEQHRDLCRWPPRGRWPREMGLPRDAVAHAILVSGPTPWGRDVPWSPA